MHFNTRFLITLIFLLFPLESAAQITLFNTLKFEGEGCPSNSVDMRIENGKTIRILTRELKAKSPVGNIFKQCIIKVPLKAPKGTVFSQLRHVIPAYFIAHQKSALTFTASVSIEANNKAHSIESHSKDLYMENYNSWNDFSAVSTLDNFYYLGCANEMYLIFDLGVRANADPQATTTASLGVGGITIDSFQYVPKENCPF